MRRDRRRSLLFMSILAVGLVATIAIVFQVRDRQVLDHGDVRRGPTTVGPPVYDFIHAVNRDVAGVAPREMFSKMFDVVKQELIAMGTAEREELYLWAVSVDDLGDEPVRWVLWSSMLDDSIVQGKFDRARDMIATRVEPMFSPTLTLESYLALSEFNGGHRGAFAVLFDAFDITTSTTSRSHLATMLERGFAFVVPCPEGAPERVQLYRDWFFANRDQLSVNSEYVSLWSTAPDPNVDMRRVGLFVVK